MRTWAEGLAEHLTDRWGRWVVPYAALWIAMLAGGIVVVTLALLGYEVYENVVDDAGLASLDKPTLALAQSMRTPELNAAVTGFTNIGGGIGMPIVGSVLTGLLMYWSRSWRPLVLIGGAAAVSITATTLSKRVVGRARPEHVEAVPPFETSPSFPSGHTLNTTVVIGMVVYLAFLLVRRLLVRVALITAGVIFIIAMGLSRVYLGHHWMTDVIAAWLLGFSWVGIVILAHRLFHGLLHRELPAAASPFEQPEAGATDDDGNPAASGPAGRSSSTG